ncbi:hypothetical protein EWM62_11265 [Mucilaginibacter terrigena]|uniref:Uncharacterized protein n=1 Tax=Mucilaginibacter terrigena TaxID=2492395 RepID=A0A4Q5LK95_9SPHI|nr:hypothetical protein [Mucilaginibacter terrigena]RYU90114.1 hypothetical protein EWM62_11265 [Mucilaginibacter terrigena]
MKRLLLIILFILPCIVFAQKKRHFKAPRVMRYYPGYNDCAYQYRFDADARRAFFPFSKAARIRLISFHEGENTPIYITEPGAAYVPDVIPAEDTMQVFSPMAKDDFFVNYCRVMEMRDLSKAAVDSLTDILYNVGRKPIKLPDDYANPGAACYSPANAILFMDSKGKITEFIEICFHCHRYYYSSSKTREIDYCDQKWDMLKKYFFSQGIKFGVVDEVDPEAN